MAYLREQSEEQDWSKTGARLEQDWMEQDILRSTDQASLQQQMLMLIVEFYLKVPPFHL
jgi:hypothetical protein